MKISIEIGVSSYSDNVLFLSIQHFTISYINGLGEQHPTLASTNPAQMP